MTVWKYELRVGYNLLEMPQYARALSVAFQGDTLCLWALVDPEDTTERREFVAVGTGYETDRTAAQFVGTAFHENGTVWHVFGDGKHIHGGLRRPT